MLQAHEPYRTSYGRAMFGAPEPPRWPRLVARIVGTVGFVLVAPFALVILLGTALNLVDGSGTNNPTLFDYVLMSLIGIASATLALGLLLAWWREGIGALLIFAGSALLVLATIGLSLLFIFTAPFVGALYLLSWALHRTDDIGNGSIDRLSRWIRQSYYGRRTETF
ncbi:MAG: hypothetical protein R3A46_03580 [Thermomicrobiales bacterium]